MVHLCGQILRVRVALRGCAFVRRPLTVLLSIFLYRRKGSSRGSSRGSSSSLRLRGMCFSTLGFRLQDLRQVVGSGVSHIQKGNNVGDHKQCHSDCQLRRSETSLECATYCTDSSSAAWSASSSASRWRWPSMSAVFFEYQMAASSVLQRRNCENEKRCNGTPLASSIKCANLCNCIPRMLSPKPANHTALTTR